MWLPLACLLPGTWPATQVYALNGSQTSDPLVLRLALNPLNHTSQGCLFFLLFPCLAFHIILGVYIGLITLENNLMKSPKTEHAVSPAARASTPRSSAKRNMKPMSTQTLAPECCHQLYSSHKLLTFIVKATHSHTRNH